METCLEATHTMAGTSFCARICFSSSARRRFHPLAGSSRRHTLPLSSAATSDTDRRKKFGYGPLSGIGLEFGLVLFRRRRHIARASADVPDYLSATWVDSHQRRAIGPRLDLSAEETVQCQLQALKYNNEPHQDHGIEVMYRFAGFDPFERSKYFGPVFDLGQFERFRRIFHHSTYRVLLSHKESNILSSLYVNENCFKQRVWTKGSRPDEEEIFEFTLVQRVGSFWDGYWLTESVRHDGEGIAGGIAY